MYIDVYTVLGLGPTLQPKVSVDLVFDQGLGVNLELKV